MDNTLHGRPPTRRRTALGDATLRANENHRTRSARHTDKLSPHVTPSSSPKPLPHNEFLDPDGSLAVRHQAHPSSQHKRVSAVVNDEYRPHNPKRDSQVSNASTNATSASSRRKSHIGPWQLGKTIGRGGCSRVRIVRHSGTGQYGAAKIISKATADKVRALSLANLVESAEHDPTLYAGGRIIPFGLEREICIMKLLDHPNIVKLYDIWENRNELYLIMEYVEGGELFSFIGERGPLPEIQVIHIFRQIVAALMYCHEINIHHRDLKPENILLDRDTMDIKLVDFGMAALQPAGKKLTTPCGSPHYAAPEVIRSRPYDGAQADVWSCGVILFVLLTGTPPFNYSGDDKDLQCLFRAITRADYIMPEGLSREAEDLIRRILIPDPKRRITLNKIWDSKFMRKYGKQLGFTGQNQNKEEWIRRPRPNPEDWKPLSETTIDREILRYMRTLWHSEEEQVLIHRLVCMEDTHEKFFYAALQKYHQDQLENYVPTPHNTIAYSNSDHHHNGRFPPTAKDVLQLPTTAHTRSHSEFSIHNDEHLRSEHSFYAPPPSDVSYDPFRASKAPIVPNHELHQNITVLRGSSNGSRKPRPATALGHHTKSSLRVQAINRNSKHGSAITRTSSKHSSPSHPSRYMRHGSVSRSSVASSQWPSSPPIVARPGSFKRGVSFSHLRRSSIATASTAETGSLPYTPERRRYLEGNYDSVGSSILSPRPSTAGASPTARKLSKAAASPLVPRLRLRKPESPTKYIQSEARKVSTELEKVMEEAFNRSSISSSVQTASVTNLHKDVPEYDTPPTSFSNRDSGGTTVATPNGKRGFESRQLPPIPVETPHTFIQRRLAEARTEIVRRLEEGGNADHFTAFLEELDRLGEDSGNVERRTVSAPAKSPEQLAPLQAIPEEVKNDGADPFELYGPTYRAVTGPVRPTQQSRRAVTEQNPVRLVDQSPTRIAPLNIRKRSGASVSTRSARDDVSAPWQVQKPDVPVAAMNELDTLTARTTQATPSNAVSDTVEKKDATVKKKKSSWFRRTLEDKERPQENEPKLAPKRSQIPESFLQLDDRIKNHPPKTKVSNLEASRQSVKHQAEASDVSEFPMRNCGTAFSKSEGSGALKGFLGLFSKKSREEKCKGSLGLEADSFSASSILSGYDLGTENAREARVRSPDAHTNWLSRFLHIKPASRILCFQVGRGRVRSDLVRILRDWQRFGVRDVTFDREKNVINARVDKSNHLKIKPVTFVIELFAVCQHGRRVKLCLARFTQTRGAASSFRKTVEVLEDVCRGKRTLVEDEEMKADMCQVLSFPGS